MMICRSAAPGAAFSILMCVPDICLRIQDAWSDHETLKQGAWYMQKMRHEVLLNTQSHYWHVPAHKPRCSQHAQKRFTGLGSPLPDFVDARARFANDSAGELGVDRHHLPHVGRLRMRYPGVG
jgi:hypothetical protein